MSSSNWNWRNHQEQIRSGRRTVEKAVEYRRRKGWRPSRYPNIPKYLILDRRKPGQLNELAKIPELIWYEIFKYLDIFDLRNLKTTCHYLKYLVNKRDVPKYRTKIIADLRELRDLTHYNRITAEAMFTYDQNYEFVMQTDKNQFKFRWSYNNQSGFNHENSNYESTGFIDYPVAHPTPYLNPDHILNHYYVYTRKPNPNTDGSSPPSPPPPDPPFQYLFVHQNSWYVKRDNFILRSAYSVDGSMHWRLVHKLHDVDVDIDLVQGEYMSLHYYSGKNGLEKALEIWKLPFMTLVSYAELRNLPGYRYSVSNYMFPLIRLSDREFTIQHNIITATNSVVPYIREPKFFGPLKITYFLNDDNNFNLVPVRAERFGIGFLKTFYRSRILCHYENYLVYLDMSEKKIYIMEFLNFNEN